MAKLFILFWAFVLFAQVYSQNAPKIWASISVGDSIVRKESQSFELRFVFLNNTKKVIDPKVSSWMLLINGEVWEDSKFMFGNGPRDSRWKSLAPGGSLVFGYNLKERFVTPGLYKVIWKGEGFESLPVEIFVSSNSVSSNLSSEGEGLSSFGLAHFNSPENRCIMNASIRLSTSEKFNFIGDFWDYPSGTEINCVEEFL